MNHYIIVMKNELKRLKERSKKTVLRLIQREEVDFKNGKFVWKETGKPLDALKYKNKFDDDDSEDEEDEIPKVEKKKEEVVKVEKKKEEVAKVEKKKEEVAKEEDKKEDIPEDKGQTESDAFSDKSGSFLIE